MSRERGMRGLVLVAFALLAVLATLDLLRSDSLLRSVLGDQREPPSRMEQAVDRVMGGAPPRRNP